MKMFWLDTETTGTDPIKNGIIQIAYIIYIDGQKKEKFNLTCNVFPKDEIEQGALDVNKITREQIAKYPEPSVVYNVLVNTFNKYINKYDKQDKFFVGGCNTKFDVEFLYNFFKKNGDNFFFSYIHPSHFDVLNLAMMVEMKCKKRIFKPNYKLGTICKCMGIKLENAHDAMADIVATREVAIKMWNIITKNE